MKGGEFKSAPLIKAQRIQVVVRGDQEKATAVSILCLPQGLIHQRGTNSLACLQTVQRGDFTLVSTDHERKQARPITKDKPFHFIIPHCLSARDHDLTAPVLNPKISEAWQVRLS